MADSQHPHFLFLKQQREHPTDLPICLVVWLCGRITPGLPLTPACPILEETLGTSSFYHLLGMLGCGAERAWTDPCPRSLWCRQPCWAKETNKNKPKKALLHCEFQGWAPHSKWLSPRQNVCLSLAVLAVVLGREIFEGSKAIAAGHVLLELFLQGFETDTVLLVGPELGDVEAGGVRHVDHVGVGKHGELVFLEGDKSSLSTCKNPGSRAMNPPG